MTPVAIGTTVSPESGAPEPSMAVPEHRLRVLTDRTAQSDRRRPNPLRAREDLSTMAGLVLAEAVRCGWPSQTTGCEHGGV